MTKFYVVFRDREQLQAAVRHSTAAKAMAEAERLSKKHKDRFFVAEIIGAFEMGDLGVKFEKAVEA